MPLAAAEAPAFLGEVAALVVGGAVGAYVDPARGRARLGPPARVPDVRPRRVLRLVPRPPRPRARGTSGHQVMTSAEPGEAWSWCYADELTL
jgi:hypothetical protein